MRKKLSVMVLAVVALLTACGAQVPDLSDADNNVAAQYVAGALLKYDKAYDDSLDYDHSLLKPTPKPTPKPAAVATAAPQQSDEQGGNQGGSENQGVEARTKVSLSELYGVSGVKVKAVSYEVANTYGESYAVCMPHSGNKLVVVKFRVSNDSGKKKKVNLAKAGLSPNLKVNGESFGLPLQSIVRGDLQYFNTTIPAGGRKQGVLIFEVKKSVEVKNVAVQFVKGSREAEVSVH